jgi:hypothetical protein
MFGMEDKNRRDQIDFFFKNAALIIGGVFAICFGTAHLDRFDLEQTLRAKLVGDTNLILSRFGAYAEQRPGRFCEVSGSYQITNTGKYPFVVEWVTIQLYELPYIGDDELLDGGITQYVAAERIEAAHRIKKGGKKREGEFPANIIGKEIKIDVGEQFGPQNSLQRSFGYIVEVDMSSEDRGSKNSPSSSSRYVLIGRARAGFDEDNDGVVDQFEDERSFEARVGPPILFLKDDLTHISPTFNLCFERNSAGP